MMNDDTVVEINRQQDIQGGAAAEYQGNTHPSAGESGVVATATTSLSKVERYPPSFFTDDVGNLKFVNAVVRHPCKMCCSIFFLALLVTFLLVSVVFANGNPFSDPDSEYDMDDVRSIHYDSLRLAREETFSSRQTTGRELQTVQSGEGVRTQEENLDITYWVFEGETDKGVFGSVTSIQGMKEALDLFTQDADFVNFCWKEYPETSGGGNDTSTAPSCRAPISALNIYYASTWDATATQAVIDELAVDYPANVQRYNDLSICIEFGLLCDEVPEEYTAEDYVWAQALDADIKAITGAWDGQGELQAEDVDQISLFCAYMLELQTKRGLVDFGFDKDFSIANPVSQYSRAIVTWGGPLDSTADSDASTDDDLLKDYIVDNFLDEMNSIASTGHNPEVDSNYFMGILILEVLLDIVTQDGLLAIASFVFVFFFLRLMVGSWFLAMVGMAEIMLSIPVSWFLYNTVFRIEYFAFLNTLTLFIVAAIGADDIFIFMDAYKQSARSKDPDILNSLESRMSWVYRRTGSAMAITSATTCSAFLCTLITPLVSVRAFGVFAATVIFIDYVLVMTLFCTAVVIYHNKFEQLGCCSSCVSCCRTVEPTSTQTAFDNLDKESDGEDISDKIGDFFRNKVSPFVNNSRNRICLAVAFVSWLVLAVVFATRIRPTQEAEQFLDESHPLQKSINILNTAFPTAEDDSGLAIHFVWGLEDVDRSGVNQLSNPDFLGAPQYSETFEFNEQCQTEMLSVCVDLRRNAEYQPHIKQEAGFGSVSCFIEEFGAYSVLGSLADCGIVRSGAWKNETWQVASADVPTMLASFVNERSCYSEEGRPIMSQYEDDLGWDGSELRFAGLSVESSVIDPFSTLPEKTVRVEYDMMVKITKDLDNVMKDACGGKTIMTDLETKFVFMNNQRIYVRSALQSSVLGVGLAFTVLMIATRVFHIALFATLSIVCVLISVTGSIVMIGWDLGSIEAILISIVAGFSVDYVVHLSHAYVQAKGSTPERITEAFGDMGISVLNGMITSVGASLPLFFCQLQFFKKFGTFLCLTIAFSWLFANFAFMSVLAQVKIPIGKKSKDSDDAELPEDAAPASTNEPEREEHC